MTYVINGATPPAIMEEEMAGRRRNRRCRRERREKRSFIDGAGGWGAGTATGAAGCCGEIFCECLRLDTDRVAVE
jgi:hypothetical protein